MRGARNGRRGRRAHALLPPGRDGRIADVVLAAAAVAGIEEIHQVGGAQAIAAMAFGTESIRRVDVVVGPGNHYVAEAKRQVSGVVGVAAAFAGPSEVVVVADGSAPAEWAAIDLVVQAEHGPNGLAFLVTTDAGFAAEVSKTVDAMVAASPRRAELEATLGYRRIHRPGRRARAGDRRRQRDQSRAFGAPGRELRTAARPGELGRRGIRGSVGSGESRRLCGGHQPRPADSAYGEVLLGSSCRRLPDPYRGCLGRKRRRHGARSTCRRDRDRRGARCARGFDPDPF